MLPDLACKATLSSALLGHKNVMTTMIHTHIVDRGPLGVVSPLDR